VQQNKDFLELCIEDLTSSTGTANFSGARKFATMADSIIQAIDRLLSSDFQVWRLLSFLVYNYRMRAFVVFGIRLLYFVVLVSLKYVLRIIFIKRILMVFYIL